MVIIILSLSVAHVKYVILVVDGRLVLRMNNFLYSMRFSFDKMGSDIYRILNITDYDNREMFLRLVHVYIGY